MNCILRNPVAPDYLFGKDYEILKAGSYTAMQTLFFFCASLIILSCKNDQQQNTVQETAGTKDTAVVEAKLQTEQNIVKEELAVIDTGHMV